ncbi:hypothetical protein [uncultured Amphritea sp.]|uniref:hypothetical protein n=1 Tax=uncultured Amphritea sp. TaxID=981605 RepID=UPI00261808CF|nr:hypothetical protein [uncultured Amphritea sp.]
MKKSFIQSVLVAVVTLAASNSALADSVGGLLSGHGTSELKAYFQFAALFFAFVGFIIAGICIIGMGMIKLAPNSPATSRFETAGMGGLAMGAMLGGALCTLTTLVYMLMGTAGGDSADGGALDKLKASTEYQIDVQGYAQVDLSFIVANPSLV